MSNVIEIVQGSTTIVNESAPVGPQGPQGQPGPPTTDAGLLASGTLLDARLSTAVTTSLGKADTASQPGHTHAIADVADLQTTLDGKQASGSYAASSHTHGNITNAGAIGATASLPVITTAGGVLTTGTFGTAANTFCQGNDSRLSDSRTPTAHTHAISDVADLQTTLDGKQASGSYAASSHVHSAATISVAGFLSTTDKSKLDGIATGAEVNVNADWTASTGDAQILNKPLLGGAALLNVGTTAGTVAAGDHLHGGGWGPLVLNRFRNFYFASSNYSPNGQNPQGMFPLTPTSGNVLEGWSLSFPFPRLFNPNQFLGPGVGYYITAYVRVSGSFNDGVHCQIRSYDGTGVSIVSGLGDFGGFTGDADRIHFATSNELIATNTFYSYALYCGAYGNGGNSNGAVIQDAVLTFHRAP